MAGSPPGRQVNSDMEAQLPECDPLCEPEGSTESRRSDIGGGALSGAVLDIGGDTGALVIYADGHMVGTEIEICPSGRIPEREHNIVRARRTPAGLVYAAVFPALMQGAYAVLTDDLEPCREVSVLGGSVTELDCRACSIAGQTELREVGLRI